MDIVCAAVENTLSWNSALSSLLLANIVTVRNSLLPFMRKYFIVSNLEMTSSIDSGNSLELSQTKLVTNLIIIQPIINNILLFVIRYDLRTFLVHTLEMAFSIYSICNLAQQTFPGSNSYILYKFLEVF